MKKKKQPSFAHEIEVLTTRNNRITLASFMKLNISTNMENGKIKQLWNGERKCDKG